MNIFEKYGYYLLEKKHLKIKRDVKLTGFGEATKVGVLWHIDDNEAFLYISDFLKDKKIVFRSLCYRDISKEEIANSFGKKEVNLFGFPKKGVTNNFIEIEYDLLMNISVSECFPLDVVVALANARLKIGWAVGQINFYDLSIDVSKNKNALYLVKQQIHYLEQFNKQKQG